jgi:hypothetical protein
MAWYGFVPIADEPLAAVAADETRLPDGERWYGLICSGKTAGGWVSIYVEDWQDSGALAERISQSMPAHVLEVWIADDTVWGYNYFENGTVRDRFANDPAEVADTKADVLKLSGNPAALKAVLKTTPEEFAALLAKAQASRTDLAAGFVERFCDAVGLNFTHAYTSHDQFFDDDSEDYSPGMEDWEQFRHLAFQHPQGKERISD